MQAGNKIVWFVLSMQLFIITASLLFIRSASELMSYDIN